MIDRQGKLYKLYLGTRQDTVCIDRLKSAFLEEATDAIEHDAQLVQQKRPNHSGDANAEVVPVVNSNGRLVRLPVRYGIE